MGGKGKTHSMKEGGKGVLTEKSVSTRKKQYVLFNIRMLLKKSRIYSQNIK